MNVQSKNWNSKNSKKKHLKTLLKEQTRKWTDE